MNKKHPRWIKKLRSRYRLMIINDSNFEEKVAVRLTPLTVIMFISSGFLFFFVLSWLLIFTVPALRMYMPGYEPDKDRKFKKEVLTMLKDYDRVVTSLEERKVLLSILLRGDELTETDMAILQDQLNPQDFIVSELESDQALSLSDSESNPFALLYSDPSASLFTIRNEKVNADKLSGIFYPPVTGKISAPFKAGIHPAIDIIPDKDESIKASYDGTIFFVGWTPNFGNVICVQHLDNWITVYKHCALVYKKKNERVSAGEVIGVVGNSGDLSTGPHLHFELWHNGIPLNPEHFVSFN